MRISVPRPAVLLVILTATALILAPPGLPAGTAGTDILKVDEFIDAPRVIFGRAREQIERRLGPPAMSEVRPVRSPEDPRKEEALHELAYPGVVIRVLASLGLLRVRVTDARFLLPYGLNVGSPRALVADVLGEAQAVSDRKVLYLYSDSFPRTVEFYFRDGRVDRIDWNYRATE